MAPLDEKTLFVYGGIYTDGFNQYDRGGGSPYLEPEEYPGDYDDEDYDTRERPPANQKPGGILYNT